MDQNEIDNIKVFNVTNPLVKHFEPDRPNALNSQYKNKKGQIVSSSSCDLYTNIVFRIFLCVWLYIDVFLDITQCLKFSRESKWIYFGLTISFICLPNLIGIASDLTFLLFQKYHKIVLDNTTKQCELRKVESIGLLTTLKGCVWIFVKKSIHIDMLFR